MTNVIWDWMESRMISEKDPGPQIKHRIHTPAVWHCWLAGCADIGLLGVMPVSG